MSTIPFRVVSTLAFHHWRLGETLVEWAETDFAAVFNLEKRGSRALNYLAELW